MKRDVCGLLIRTALTPATLVMCSLGTANRTWRAQGASNLTYYGSDPMGVALPMAMGFALSRPKDQILLIGGDGDLVMGLGSLLTVAHSGVRNLKVIILNNGRYETGGSQPLAVASGVTLSGLARAAGWPFAQSVQDEATARTVMAQFFAAPGLAFLDVAADIEPSPYPQPGTSSQVEDRTLFMAALAARS
jgi:thiamine pyrophosphate-dependent acetolactate synthase large subunit-like protein